MSRLPARSLAGFLLLFLAASPALGDQIKLSTYNRYEGQWWTVNAGPLNVRESPRVGARVATQVHVGDEVAVLEIRQEIVIGERRGKWTFIATPQCVNAACEHVIAGWVANIYLDDPLDTN